jgi:hypothetical protein
MRFFTREWALGAVEEGEALNAVESYEAHLLRIAHALPEHLRELTERVSLHDGLVQKAVSRRDGVFDLLIRAGDLQCGYFDAVLHYRDVSSVAGDPSPSVLLAGGDFEILYDEIDLASNGEVEHRLLLSPDGELLVRFSGFDYAVVPAGDRSFNRRVPVFESE